MAVSDGRGDAEPSFMQKMATMATAQIANALMQESAHQREQENRSKDVAMPM
jgi:hypothetical protein